MLDSVMTLSVMDMVALVVAGIFGLLWHYVAKLVELRKDNRSLTMSSYFLDHVPETLASLMAVLAGIWGLVELGQATIFNVLIMSYTIDSHANKFRGRAEGLLK